jgi:hypothetical protein
LFSKRPTEDTDCSPSFYPANTYLDTDTTAIHSSNRGSRPAKKIAR